MIEAIDLQLVAAVQEGLPIASRPYALIAEQLNLDEAEVISRLAKLKQQGLIKRLGVIVKHRRLGYQSNAMVVFNIPDALVNQMGQQVSQFQFINLCYQRPRHGEHWPYNLFCMIHGKSREKVQQQLSYLIESCALENYAHDILFSRRCFKQRGAVYFPTPVTANK
ncbi:protein nirL [Methyloprofundus sedimenti]|uniref:siroheme decarboxylase n=1 Tax=Methyloprofundus sedimenti TaxID=1420851 RepID=A0A1V8M2G9_9GAMM|nr:AsnC family transcriptional regulator [Methyloprofundus sedimenti]OQK15751.1 protein nirL [Methyloprofundus sedimenti]